MALHEGCRRLRLAGKVLVVTGLAIAVVAATSFASQTGSD